MENEKKAKAGNSFSMMLENLKDFQQNLMLNPTENYLWMQEKVLQDQFQNHAVEQEIYWAQRTNIRNLFQFGDTN